jgi:SAM-dependent methyltransferase
MMTDNTLPRLYKELASWWPLLSSPEDYANEAAFYRDVLISACSASPKTMLELGSGGGNNASYLKHHFQMTLVDLSPDMLAVSRLLNPGIEHVAGDMRTIRLGQLFDAVFIHDAIMYMTNEQDLCQAIQTAYVHCRTGGAALFAPDHVRETFRSSTKHGGHDGEHKSMRYLEWTWDPDPSDSTYVVDFAYLLREGAKVYHEYDRHIFGLFGRDDWMRMITEVGFIARTIPSEHGEIESEICEIFVGVKPPADANDFADT